MDNRNEKRTEIIFNNFDLRLTMSNEQQARWMLTATVNPAGGFEYAGEFYPESYRPSFQDTLR